MAKHRYSEVKHPDKFAEALSAFWSKIERYIVPIGLVTLVLLAVATIWIVVSRRYTASSQRPWDQRFQLAEEFQKQAQEGREAKADGLLGKMMALAKDYQGRPVAAITLLEASESYLRLGESRREENAKGAQEDFERAANAAEQFLADFPSHPLAPLAHYDAGRARLALGEYERAARHFEGAAQSRIRFLAVLAQLDGALCYQKLGRLDDARRLYETLRDDQTAGWCAEQAEFELAQLGRQPAKDTPRGTGSPPPSPATPAPSK